MIDEHSKEPAYIQLYTQVRDDIIKGIYPFNSKLPSERNFSLDTGVSTITVEHAYSLLCDEGYIEPKERSGYFVILNTDAGFISPPSENIIFNSYKHTSSSITDFPFSVLAKTMRSVISDFGEAILERSPNFGCIELREAIRIYLAEEVYTVAEIVIEKLPLGNDGIESTSLHNSKADILHISPYRSFPSGVTATASKRHEYLAWADENGKYIIEDDFESEFSLFKKHLKHYSHMLTEVMLCI